MLPHLSLVLLLGKSRWQARIELRFFAEMDDEALIRELTKVKGIGEVLRPPKQSPKPANASAFV